MEDNAKIGLAFIAGSFLVGSCAKIASYFFAPTKSPAPTNIVEINKALIELNQTIDVSFAEREELVKIWFDLNNQLAHQPALPPTAISVVTRAQTFFRPATVAKHHDLALALHQLVNSYPEFDSNQGSDLMYIQDHTQRFCEHHQHVVTMANQYFDEVTYLLQAPSDTNRVSPTSPSGC